MFQIQSVKVGGQQASVTAANERAVTLTQTTHDPQIQNDSAQVVKRYNTVRQTAKVSCQVM